MTLASRLATIEQTLVVLSQRQFGINVYWPGELIACLQHPGCHREVGTGRHLANVLTLSWDSEASR